MEKVSADGVFRSGSLSDQRQCDWQPRAERRSGSLEQQITEKTSLAASFEEKAVLRVYSRMISSP